MSKELYCKYCKIYTGTIREAKLMKGLQIETVCPSCDAYNRPTYTKSKPDVPDFLKDLFK